MIIIVIVDFLTIHSTPDSMFLCNLSPESWTACAMTIIIKKVCVNTMLSNQGYINFSTGEYLHPQTKNKNKRQVLLLTLFTYRTIQVRK